MKHIHYEDENSRYITMGCVEKVIIYIMIAKTNEERFFFSFLFLVIQDVEVLYADHDQYLLILLIINGIGAMYACVLG